ncbi:MAG: hypothetical protein RL238_1457 [Actinomycetota bacterium]|jgi:hypothetical protein
MDVTEVIGYVASALVVLSLAMTSVVRLRVISLVGSVVFVVYGTLIGSVPIIITNVAIAALNVWFLRNELGGHRALGAVEVSVDSPFLVDFLQFHLADIRRFQPTFEIPAPADDVLAMVLMRDGLPAGAWIGRRDGADVHVLLDHVTKPYRDSQLSTWLYGKGSAVFRREGVERLVTAPGADAHRTYLERMGFRREGDRYVLDLT